jgi:hypothetical protein
MIDGTNYKNTNGVPFLTVDKPERRNSTMRPASSRWRKGMKSQKKPEKLPNGRLLLASLMIHKAKKTYPEDLSKDR